MTPEHKELITLAAKAMGYAGRWTLGTNREEAFMMDRGRYEGIPVCAECYRNGNLCYWLRAQEEKLHELGLLAIESAEED